MQGVDEINSGRFCCSYDGAVFDGTLDGAVQPYLKRNERGSDDEKKKGQLVETAGDDGGRPFVGGLSLHPGQHVLAANSEVAAHAYEQLFWDWDLENGFQTLISVKIGTKFPHMKKLMKGWRRMYVENGGVMFVEGGDAEKKGSPPSGMLRNLQELAKGE